MAKSATATGAIGKSSDISGMLGAMQQSTSMDRFLEEMGNPPAPGPTPAVAVGELPSETAPPPSASPTPPPGTPPAPVRLPSPRKSEASQSTAQTAPDEAHENDCSQSPHGGDTAGVDATTSLIAQSADEFYALNLQLKSLASVGMKHIFITPRSHNILLMLAEYTVNVKAPVPMQTILENILNRFFKANEKPLRSINRRNSKYRDDRFDV